MTVVDVVRMARAGARTIFVMFSLGLLGALLYTMHQPVVYAATSVGYMSVNCGNSVSEAFGCGQLASSKLSTYAATANDTATAQMIIDELGLKDTSPDAIAGRFAVSPDANSLRMTITAYSASPQQAQEFANAAIDAMSKRAQQLEDAALPSGAPASSVVKLVASSQAGLPSVPISPSYKRNLLAGALVGVLLGIGIELLRRQLDTRIRSVDDTEALIGTSALSIIPDSDEFDRISEHGLVASQTGPAAEALRTLRTNLRFVDVDHPPQSIVMTSANAGEGKSVVSANLARVLAAAGQRTVIIDADLRRPVLASIFELDPALGLTQVLAGDVDLDEVIQDTGLINLQVITAGRIPPNPSELLGSQKMQHVIRELIDDGYLVIIDAPPLLPVTDAGLVSATVDGTILVLSVGNTYKEQAKLAAKILDQVGGNLLGAVLNRAPLKGIGSVVYGYGYNSYSQDHYGAYVYGGSRGMGSRLRRQLEKRKRRDDDARAV